MKNLFILISALFTLPFISAADSSTLSTGKSSCFDPGMFPVFTYDNADNKDPDWVCNYASHTNMNKSVEIEAESGARIRIVICESGLIRVVYAPSGEFEPDVSYSVIRFDWPAVPYHITDRKNELVISTDELHVRVWKQPLRIDFFDRDHNLLSRDNKGLGSFSDKQEFTHPLFNRSVAADESLYGLGERVATRLPLNGTSFENWNYDAYNADAGMRYKSHYLYLSTAGYGVFIDNPSRMNFHIDNEHRPNQIEAEGHAGEMDCYFLHGPGFREVLGRYQKLTGGAYMPPKWAVGYQQCRWAYETQERVEKVAQEFRTRDIPCDVIWLDGPDRGWWRNGNNFVPAFDDRYPDPQGMIKTIGDQGFRLALLVNHTMDEKAPAFAEGLEKDFYVKNQDGSVFLADQWAGLSATVDFTKPGAGEWYASLFNPLVDMGVAGWWIDMNDGGFPEGKVGYYNAVFHDGPGRSIHNPMSLLDSKALYEHLEAYTARRPFVMVRGGFSGQQRYAWTWSADLKFDEWDDMLAQLRMEQSMGLMGVVYGSDAAGCAGTLGGNGESFARWMQMSVFNFFTRSHVNGCEDKEPWSYGAKAEAAVTKWLRWKYSMLPYIYTAACEMNRTGVPLHRPLVFDFPDDPQVRNMADEFLFGDWFLVAPIVNGDTNGCTDVERSVYLPEGRWIDYRDGRTVYEGPKTIDSYNAPLEDIPIFVKAGAIIPMEDWTEFVGERSLDLVTLDVYPWGTSSYTRYEDDGESLDYQKGEYCQTRYECVEQGSAVTFTIRARNGKFSPPNRDYRVVLHSCSGVPAEVTLDDKPLNEVTSEELNAGTVGWTRDAGKATLTVGFPDTGSEIRLFVRQADLRESDVSSAEQTSQRRNDAKGRVEGREPLIFTNGH
ncbi:MAG: DUF4968 domain-containing protein [Pontiellaceae bacterium]|nr:DUF4968 domain-containing protein [Pontiellaceae bacterium]